MIQIPDNSTILAPATLHLSLYKEILKQKKDCLGIQVLTLSSWLSSFYHGQNKSDIEKFGIENFCKECNKETDSNIDEVKKVTEMMGQFIDCTNPYITCTNDYIESEWWLIKNIFDKGLIYHGNKVLPYCPRCGTELSQNEVSQGYQQDSVNTVIVPFKLVEEDCYLLVWTTTPWTLIDNVAACVNPEYEYKIGRAHV